MSLNFPNQARILRDLESEGDITEHFANYYWTDFTSRHASEFFEDNPLERGMNAEWISMLVALEEAYFS
jgi:hypothetical protein